MGLYDAFGGAEHFSAAAHLHLRIVLQATCENCAGQGRLTAHWAKPNNTPHRFALIVQRRSPYALSRDPAPPNILAIKPHQARV